MMSHATDRVRYHECGGTILAGGVGVLAHNYCDRCGAYQYVSDDEPFPRGIDAAANLAAWDACEDRSPDE